MENSKSIHTSGELDFSEDYKNLLLNTKDSNSVIVVTEWSQEGDSFKKFSLYDNNYSPVIISSSTSLISDF